MGTVSVDPPGAMCDNLGDARRRPAPTPYSAGHAGHARGGPGAETPCSSAGRARAPGPAPCTCVMDGDTSRVRRPSADRSRSRRDGWRATRAARGRCRSSARRTPSCVERAGIPADVHEPLRDRHRRASSYAHPIRRTRCSSGWTSGACVGTAADVPGDGGRGEVRRSRCSAGRRSLAVTLESFEGGSGVVNIDPAEHACARTRRARRRRARTSTGSGRSVQLVATAVRGLGVHRVDLGRVLGAVADVPGDGGPGEVHDRFVPRAAAARGHAGELRGRLGGR